nr:ATP-binding cassette domain-containing protein [Aquabacter cavernae]
MMKAGEREILAPLSLSLARGKVHGLIGPNGSGKSTLLKVLARQLAPSAGSVRLEGRPLPEWRGRAFARKVAYMPQFTPAADGLSVRELVALGRYPWHGALGRFGDEDRAAVDGAIRRTGLSAFEHRQVDNLSGGERQRAWLAVMLAQDADCLLLDEPTSALDIAHQMEVLDIVRDLTLAGSGMAVIVVLHDINLAARTCDDLVALRGGRLVAQGACTDILTPETLHAIYGVPMGVMPHPVSGAPLGYVL